MTTPDPKLRELARSRIIANKIGLISKAELEEWADQKILSIANPPDFLISMSMGNDSELNFVERLDLVRDKPNDKDAASIAVEVLQRLGSGKLDVAGLEDIALKCERVLDQESNYWAKFSWISDELYLAREGVKDASLSHAEVMKVLKEMIP